MKRFILAVLSTSLVTACATTSEFEKRTRTFDPGDYAAKPKSQSGSLFAAASGGLLEDVRPASVGDVVIVRIQESDSAMHDSSTKLDRSQDFQVGIDGALEKLAPDAGLADLFGTSSESAMEGGGRIARRGQLKAMLPVRVRNVLPNGDLYVEGTKVVEVGNEARQLYLSGVVRRADVLADGSVLSSKIADAEISYTGQGDATDQQEVGWLARLLSYIWPF